MQIKLNIDHIKHKSNMSKILLESKEDRVCNFGKHRPRHDKTDYGARRLPCIQTSDICKTIKPFPIQTHEMISYLSSYHPAVAEWSSCGEIILIKDKVLFSGFLSKFFNTKQYVSFTKQMNVYGFIRLQPQWLISDNKVKIVGNIQSTDAGLDRWWHPCFMRDSAVNLNRITSKSKLKALNRKRSRRELCSQSKKVKSSPILSLPKSQKSPVTIWDQCIKLGESSYSSHVNPAEELQTSGNQKESSKGNNGTHFVPNIIPFGTCEEDDKEIIAGLLAKVTALQSKMSHMDFQMGNYLQFFSGELILSKVEKLQEEEKIVDTSLDYSLWPELTCDDTLDALLLNVNCETEEQFSQDLEDELVGLEEFDVNEFALCL